MERLLLMSKAKSPNPPAVRGDYFIGHPGVQAMGRGPWSIVRGQSRRGWRIEDRLASWWGRHSCLPHGAAANRPSTFDPRPSSLSLRPGGGHGFVFSKRSAWNTAEHLGTPRDHGGPSRNVPAWSPRNTREDPVTT